MNIADDLPVLSFDSQQSWEAWLDKHHAGSKGVWLKMAKKSSGIPSVDYAQALESALCYGWIDSQKAPAEGDFWLQRFTPRGPRSKWSKINRERAEALIEAGRMRPPGLKQMELARADGRWEAAYESQSRITIPEDFQAELEKEPQARAFFDTLNSTNRYAILYRIQTAKKPETRLARIRKFIEMLLNGQRIYP